MAKLCDPLPRRCAGWYWVRWEHVGFWVMYYFSESASYSQGEIDMRYDISRANFPLGTRFRRIEEPKE